MIFFAGTGLHYKAGDEPEPIDLTHLNIEAAMMCLASKIRLLCGKANSPTLSSRTFRFKELDAKRGGNNTTTDNFKVGTLFFEKENHNFKKICLISILFMTSIQTTNFVFPNFLHKFFSV